MNSMDSRDILGFWVNTDVTGFFARNNFTSFLYPPPPCLPQGHIELPLSPSLRTDGTPQSMMEKSLLYGTERRGGGFASRNQGIKFHSQHLPPHTHQNSSSSYSSKFPTLKSLAHWAKHSMVDCPTAAQLLTKHAPWRGSLPHPYTAYWGSCVGSWSFFLSHKVLFLYCYTRNNRVVTESTHPL